MARRRVRAIVVAAAIACGCTGASADPISLIGYAIVQGFGLTGLAALAVTAVASLLGAADARRKQRAAAEKQRAAYNASLQDRSVTVLSNESPWQTIYGNPAPVGGTMIALFTSGDKDQFKHMVIEYAAHECTAIDEVYIEGDPVGTLDGSGWATAGAFFEAGTDTSVTEYVLFTSGTATLSHAPVSVLSAVESSGTRDDSYVNVDHTAAPSGGNNVFSSGMNGIYLWVTYTYSTGVSRVNVQKHLSPAGVDTADAFLMAAVPSLWTSAHKASGHTYIVITVDLRMARFQGGPPNVTAKIRGKKIYDYRTATTIYSVNPALCVADFLTAVYGYAATAGQIDSAAAIVAANACDSQGFYCNGVVRTDAARESNLQALEDSMAGQSHWSGGVWRIMAGAWTSPVMDLTDNDVSAPIEIVQVANTATARYNTVRGKYAPAAGLGVVSDFTPYIVSGYVTADGYNRVLDAQYPFTATNTECRKLAAIAVEKSRGGMTLNYPATMRAWALQPGDRVTVTNAEFGFAAKTFRVQDWAHVNNAPLALVLVEDLASFYTGTYSAADPATVGSNLADPWARPAVPTGMVAASGDAQLLKNSDGSIITRALITWNPSTVRAVLQGGYAQLQWREAASAAEQWNSQDLAPDSTSAYLMNVPDATNIIVRLRFITQPGAQGFWANLNHFVTGKSALPAAFDTFTIIVQPDGTRQYNFSYSSIARQPPDWLGAEIRYVPGTVAAPDWASMTLLQDATTYYTNSPVELNAPLSGAFTFACKSLDTSGNESAYLVRNITLPDRRLGNVFDEFFEHTEGWTGVKTGCHIQGTGLEANDSVTWATLPSTWTAWTRWNTTPTSPITYETPGRDFGTVVAGQFNASVDADGTVLLEIATSTNGIAWSAYGSAAAPFSTRYLKARITVTATGPAPVPAIRTFSYQINAQVKFEYLNDIVLSSLTGSYRIGTGDIRIPMMGTYTVIKRTTIVIQDNSAGSWTWQRIDQSLSPAPRYQFKLNGTLADPSFVDFYVEGY